jgi:intracellular septation protein
MKVPTEMAPPRKAHPYVRAIVDYGGLFAFFVAFYTRPRFIGVTGGIGWTLAIGGHGPRDLTAATWWLVIGSAVSLLIGLIVERRVALMPLVAGGLAMFFGGLTLIFHDPRIIMFKPTAVNLLFAAALFGGLALKRNPLKALLGEALTMPEQAWRTLTFRYGLFFVAMAAANEVIRRTQSQVFWLNFHSFGFTALAILFSFTQVPLMMKYMRAPEAPDAPVE